MTDPNAPPGWYPDGQGGTRYWNGVRWVAPTPPPKKRRMYGWWALALVVGGVIIAIGYTANTDGGGNGGGTTGRYVPPSTHEVVYELDGSAPGADITISSADGGTSQQEGVDVPLTTKSGQVGLHFTMTTGQFMYISAQNTGDGTLTCTITEDGLEVSHNTASGEFAIATCQGRA